ncbi:MAG: phosphate ABC transporter ATP-binding protein [Dethiobacteria bacterium]|jgi:tungstate transport system ATP-binding protein|nr:phosphate ABC transporter ATP-binding protein [Bacillota bacterium]
MSNKYFIEIENLTKRYTREVLNIPRLSLERGKIYGIIGPSGAGKSTLLRILNLITPPDSGEIRFDGQPVPENSAARLSLQRRMTLVFQKPVLFKTSVRENVAYGLKARGFKQKEIAGRVGALLEQVGMREMAERRADTLSGGEAQRVALARAVAFNPELLLLDEPTANLDPANVELMEKLIVQLNRDSGMTIIMVTHNIFQARRLAHLVIFLYQGSVVEMGETGQLFDNPADSRTRAFIEGRMIY